MKTFDVSADIGSVKVGGDDAFYFFDNGMGDGGYKCRIYEKGHKVDHIMKKHLEFVTTFIVRTKGTIYLYSYDCGGARIHCFKPGRYFVYNRDGDVYIFYNDDEIDR